MSLNEYHKKRSFDRTPEPRGELSRKDRGKPLMFVVQKHDASRLHYDFRLEVDGVLKSWAVPKGPSLNPKEKRLAMMTEDHPLSYASFEGTIPKGQYGGGEVIVWDTGVYTSAETSDLSEAPHRIREGLHKGDLKIVLLGEKLKGTFGLVKLKKEDDNAWLLIKKKDAFASDTDVTEQAMSVRTDAVLPRDKEKKGKNAERRPDPMPNRIRPMLAKLAGEPFDKDGWIFEIKWDGYRAIAEVDEQVELYSRNGNSFTKAYPDIVRALAKIPNRCILDGEIIALQGGKVSFQALQHYKENRVPLQYAVFDILYLDGKDLRKLPLIERKEILQSVIPKDDPILIYSEHVTEKGRAFFKEIERKGIEGIMAKHGESTYQSARTDEWLKIKTYKEQEAIIVGYTEPRNSRRYFGSLVLAVNEKDKLRYVGHSGGGFSGTDLRTLHERLVRIRSKYSPFDAPVPVNSPITWVRPKYICEVRFSEWTKDGRMRHPIFKGLRSDKTVSEITKEEPIQGQRKDDSLSAELRLTNTEKVFWPDEGYTKGDLIAYYDEVSDLLLPYLKDRPQNLNRHPNGITGKNFYQKNMEMELPSFVETKEIWSESNGAYLRYIICQNRETLLYLVNLGCIEINPWHSRIERLDRPDYMVLDLDPNDRSFDDLIKVAREVRAVLNSACEDHYLKTSGKSGLHIVIPLEARYTYDEIRLFSELIMQVVARQLPDITSIERSPSKRKGKIYLDYLQNRFGQTLACAYSVRPYPQATISTPIDWSELRKGFMPSRYNLKTMKRRLKNRGDLWRPVIGKGVDLKMSIQCLREFLDA